MHASRRAIEISRSSGDQRSYKAHLRYLYSPNVQWDKLWKECRRWIKRITSRDFLLCEMALHCHFTEGQLKHEKLKASLLPPLLSMSNVFSSLTPLMTAHFSRCMGVFRIRSYATCPKSQRKCVGITFRSLESRITFSTTKPSFLSLRKYRAERSDFMCTCTYPECLIRGTGTLRWKFH